MKRMSERTMTAIAVLLMASVMVASCNINPDKAGDAFRHLGENLDNAVNGTEETIQETVAETEPTVSEETEETEDAEETEASETTEQSSSASGSTLTLVPTPTPTPEPTPTPAPEPASERVDFSELTEDELRDGTVVEIEDFEESFVNEDEVTLVSFTGNRILISQEDSPYIQTSVNLILDGFYLEAEGVYNRYTAEAQAEYALPVEEEAEAVYSPYAVSCNYDYGYNGRVLSVIMTYGVTRGDETVAEHREYVSFDMYTGQYITTASVVEDYELFRTTCGNTLAFATENEEDNADSFTDIFIFVEGSGNGVYVYGTAADGTVVRALADIENIAPALNRYGSILYTNR